MFVMYDTHLVRPTETTPGRSRTVADRHDSHQFRPRCGLGAQRLAVARERRKELSEENEGADFAGSERTKPSLARSVDL
jgi:hypothetical protein